MTRIRHTRNVPKTKAIITIFRGIVRKITADMVFTGTGYFIREGVVVLGSDGRIIETLENRNNHDPAELEIHRGLICPGFINAHCHLELSHMKGRIKEGLGLPAFVKSIIETRTASSEEQIQDAIEKAELEMIKNGIVGVGDICNGTASFVQKQKAHIMYHTFVEVFDLEPENTEASFSKAREVYDAIPKGQLKSMTLHSPYTCTPGLFKKVEAFNDEQSILSVHFQESSDENKLYQEKSGAWIDFYKTQNRSMDWFEPSGKNSLESCLGYLERKQRVLAVHGTYTEEEELRRVQGTHPKLHFCTCPRANLYIEQRLPDYRNLIWAGAHLCVGTDSLASNYSLSILEELKVISEHGPIPSLSIMLEWATVNGADLLGFGKELGSIRRGKRPGLNLIENLDLDKMRLLPESSVKVLA